MTPLVFVHGWGSAPFIWKDVTPAFQSYTCHTPNLGFMGEENLNNIPNTPFIGIGHSLGGIWLLKHYKEQMVGFISIASFTCFYQHTPRHALRAMQKNVLQNPEQQLYDFWQYAGMEQPNEVCDLNTDKLHDGLKNLAQWQVEKPENTPYIALASHDDKIVPENMTKDIWPEKNINWINTGGHMLPLSQPDFCIKNIQNMIDTTS